MSQEGGPRKLNQDGGDVATNSASRDHNTALAIIPNPCLREQVSISHINGGTDKVVDTLSATIPPTRDPSFDMTQSQAEEQDPAIILQESEECGDKEKEISDLRLAVVQIDDTYKQNRRRHDNQERRKRSPFELFKRPTRVQIDGVKYSPNFYASLDTAVQALSQRAIHLLGLLSFFHYANIPRLLFTVAAKSMFAYEEIKPLPRPPEFKDCIQLLKDILCPSGEWKEEELDILVEELRKHSIITLVPTGATISIRFHPLVHTWARQRLSKEEEVQYQAAAIRLFASSITTGDDYALYEHLCPHALYICPELGVLHVNDRVAISRIVGHSRDNALLLSMWRNIRNDVKSVRGSDHFLMMSQLNREVGYATWLNGDRTGSEAMYRENIAANEEMFGNDKLETIWSRASLARLLRRTGRVPQAEEIEKENLRTLLRTQGLKSLATANAMYNLATTLGELGRHEDRLPLLVGVVEIRTKILGRSAQRTIWALEDLSQNNEPSEAEKIRKEVLELRQKLHGKESRQAVAAIVWLASRYYQQKRYKEAKELRQMEWEARKSYLGRYHVETLGALSWLARVNFELRQFVNAERLYKELWSSRRGKYGIFHNLTLFANYWVGRTAFEQSRYNEAETLWSQWLDGCRKFHTNEHIETLNAMHWVARAYSQQQNYSDAADLWTERLQGCKRVLGEQNITTIFCYGWLSYSQSEMGYYSEAERLRKQELEGIQQLQGKTSLNALVSMESLAKVYTRQKRFVEAEEIRKEVFEVRTKTLGVLHANTLKAKLMLGMTYHDQGRTVEAERLWKTLLPQIKKVHSKTHTDYLFLVSSLSKVYSSLENYTDAEVMQKEYLEACKIKHAKNHIDTLWAMHSLASTWHKLGKFEDAERLWNEELAIRRTMKNQALTARVSDELAQHYLSVGKLEEAKTAIEEAIRIRRRTLAITTPTLVKNLRLLASIMDSIQTNVSMCTEESVVDKVEDSAPLDPGGDPTFIPPKHRHVVTQIEPHYRPSTLRLVFGLYPNHWNMF